MITKEQLISDIILRISDGKPSDDLELEPRQVAFWIDLLLPNLVAKALNDKLAKGGMIDPIYLTVEDCVPAKIKTLDCRDCQDNVYFDLCTEPLNLNEDRGIVRFFVEKAETNEFGVIGAWVDLMRADEIEAIRVMRFSKPSLKNIKAHRVGKRIYLHGLTSDTYTIPQFNITYVPVPSTIDDLSDTDEIKITDELKTILAEEVEKIARRQMLSDGINDEENDARQNINQQPTK